MKISNRELNKLNQIAEGGEGMVSSLLEKNFRQTVPQKRFGELKQMILHQFQLFVIHRTIGMNRMA